MMDYDLHTPGTYAEHLAAVNDTHAVVATEDIVNSRGLLLMAKGLPFKTDMAARLLNHRLTRPLDTSVSIDNSLGAQTLYDAIQSMLQQWPDCLAIHQALRLDSLLIAQCQHFERHPLLAQKLTVLSLRLPEDYHKALFCGWFALALARQQALSPRTCEAAFLAGLLHDIGMLHIDPEIVSRPGPYNAEQWRAMQGHTLIADRFLQQVADLPPGTREAVREHHERCDGSGYPAGLFEEQLSQLGQMVAMADTLYAVRRKGGDDGPLGLGAMVPILQVNANIHSYAVFAATMGLIRLTELPGLPPVPSSHIESVCTDLLGQYQKLKSRLLAAVSLRELLEPQLQHHHIRMARLIFERLWTIVVRSGSLSDPMARWIEHVGRERLLFAADEMAEVRLMYQEMTWHLLQFGQALNLIARDVAPLPAPLRQALEQVLPHFHDSGAQALAVS